MPQQIINDLESGLVVRTKLNDMFGELYSNIPIPTKLGTLSGNTNQDIPGNSFVATLEMAPVAGAPLIKVGITPGGEELFPLTTLTQFVQSNTQLYLAADSTIYFTLSGGSVKARIDVISNYL